MHVTDDNLKQLDTDFGGYLEGEQVDHFFDCYGIQFSAGHWCAGGSNGSKLRADNLYVQENSKAKYVLHNLPASP